MWRPTTRARREDSPVKTANQTMTVTGTVTELRTSLPAGLSVSLLHGSARYLNFKKRGTLEVWTATCTVRFPFVASFSKLQRLGRPVPSLGAMHHTNSTLDSRRVELPCFSGSPFNANGNLCTRMVSLLYGVRAGN